MYHVFSKADCARLTLGQRFITTLRANLEQKLDYLPVKDSIRFYKQDIRWNLSNVKQHSVAAAIGLVELGFQPGKSTVASCLQANAENVGLSLGGMMAGVNVAQVNGKIQTVDGLKKMLKETKCRGLVVQSEDVPLIYQAIPSLKTMPKIMDSPLELEEFPDLKYVIHTEYTPHRGLHRFRDVLVYFSAVPTLENIEDKLDYKALEVVDPKTGSIKESFTQEQLVNKALAAVDSLKLDPDSRVAFASNNIAPSLVVASLACVLSAAKLIVPSADINKELLQRAVELESCRAAIGDAAPAGLKAWVPR